MRPSQWGQIRPSFPADSCEDLITPLPHRGYEVGGHRYVDRAYRELIAGGHLKEILIHVLDVPRSPTWLLKYVRALRPNRSLGLFEHDPADEEPAREARDGHPLQR